MKNRVFLYSALAALVASVSLGAQGAAPALLGAWRADVPLPNGVVQTFRFGADGAFDLSMTLSVDGTYSAHGNQLFETVALPTGETHTDSSTFTVAGDSLVVNENAGPAGAGTAARVLYRSPGSGTPGIVGEWTIALAAGTTAHYTFAADGSMYVRAQVGDETGTYTVHADTLHLSNDRTFQIPATARFAVAGDVLTLTPPNGKSARQFHRVATTK